MATIFIEGFDKYGPPGLNTGAGTVPAYPQLSNVLPQGGWTLANTNNMKPTIAAGLSGQGYALAISAVTSGSSSDAPGYVSKTLPQNYSRLIGGFRFNSDVLGLNGISFVDGSTPQCSIYINRTSGFITVNTGGIAQTQSGATGTALGTSSASVAANSNHYLEYDITFAGSGGGSYTIWLDGVEILSGGGTTIVTTNAYANVVQFNSYTNSLSTNTPSFQVDDVYLFDPTTSYNNAVLLSNPFIITQFPTSDSSVQFTPEAVIVGYPTANLLTNTNEEIFANHLYLLPVVPEVNCTANSIVIMCESIAGAPQVKPAIYANSSGVPGSLLSGGSGVTPSTTNQPVTLPLTSSVALTAGTTYWIGFIVGGTYGNFNMVDGTSNGYTASATYSSGPPSTAPTMTSGQSTVFLYAACTAPGHNFAAINLNPAQGAISYVQDGTVGAQDTFGFAALPSYVGSVYTVVVSANVEMTAAGSHTLDLVAISGGTTGNGAKTGQALTTSYAWYDSPFDTDPNTTLPWSATNVSLATYGYKLAS